MHVMSFGGAGGTHQSVLKTFFEPGDGAFTILRLAAGVQWLLGFNTFFFLNLSRVYTYYTSQ
jgi:hypothetical protein